MVAPGVRGMAGSAQTCGNPGLYLWFCQANKGCNVAVILLQKTCFCNSAWGSALRLLLSSYSLWFPTSNPFLICGATYFATFPLLEDYCNTKCSAFPCQITGMETEAVRECCLNLLSTPVPSHKTYFSNVFIKHYGGVMCPDFSQPRSSIFLTDEMDRSQVFFS